MSREQAESSQLETETVYPSIWGPLVGLPTGNCSDDPTCMSDIRPGHVEKQVANPRKQ